MSSQGFKKLLDVRSDGQGDPMIGPHVHMGPIKITEIVNENFEEDVSRDFFPGCPARFPRAPSPLYWAINSRPHHLSTHQHLRQSL